MARQEFNEEPADFVRRMGWSAGMTLFGEQIIKDGRVLEGPVIAVLTAVGADMVLARSYFADRTPRSRESSFQFGSREWSLANHLYPWPKEARND